MPTMESTEIELELEAFCGDALTTQVTVIVPEFWPGCGPPYVEATSFPVVYSSYAAHVHALDGSGTPWADPGSSFFWEEA